MRQSSFNQDAIDIVFVIDTTGSMMGKRNAFLPSLHKLVNSITQITTGYRICVVSFGDLTVRGDKITSTEFTNSIKQIESDLENLPSFNGGNNVGESALEAIQHAINLPFRQFAAKAVILLTDEPALPTIPIQSIVSRLLEKEITTIVASPRIDYYLEFAQKTGGVWQEFLSRDTDTLPNSAIEVIKKLLLNRHRPLPVAPPPRLPKEYTSVSNWLIALAIALGIFAQFNLLPSGTILISKMLSLTLGACLVPTITSKIVGEQNRLLRIVFETLLLSGIFAGFGYWFLDPKTNWLWLLYATSIVLILEVGSHLVERYAVKTVNRVFRNTTLKNMLGDAEGAKTLLHKELFFYGAFPLGMLVGIFWGFFNKWTSQEIIVLCVLAVLSLASFILILSLITTFIRMVEPLFRENKESLEKSRKGKNEKTKGLFGAIRFVMDLIVEKPYDESDLKEKQDLSIAYIATDLRKIYLYNAAHNVTLLFAFVFSGASLINIFVDLKWVILSLLSLSLVFVQLPYMIGQSLLHEQVLDKYEGTQRADIIEKLRKNAPLFPTSDFLAALSATGTAGGLLYYVLDNFLKEILK